MVEKFSVREEREDENNQEEVVKSQSALHVAHFGSTLAKIFWLEALWHHSYSYAIEFLGVPVWCVSNSMENTRCDLFYL